MRLYAYLIFIRVERFVETVATVNNIEVFTFRWQHSQWVVDVPICQLLKTVNTIVIAEMYMFVFI